MKEQPKQKFASLMHETLDLLQKFSNFLGETDDTFNRQMDLAKRKMSDQIEDGNEKSKDLN